MFNVLYRKHNHGVMSCRNYQFLFANGSSNFRKTVTVTHFTSEMHLSEVKLEEKEKCDREGNVNQEKVTFLDPGKTSIGFSL